jgi:hypothetical protein
VTNPNILLVGCAKDEAAYLPEWIFYHLSIGIKSIHIYVNNTSDNSVTILEKIAKHYPVSYTVADPLIRSEAECFHYRTNKEFLAGNPIQAKCYIDAYENVDPNLFSYVAYLDIDEFLHPSSNLKKLMSPEPGPDIVKIEWFNLTGDSQPFTLLNKTKKGTADVFHKSIVRTGISDLRIEDPHTCSTNRSTGDFSREAIILHRVLRSRKEYLFLLARSTAEKKDILTNGFKKNRRGWTTKASDTYQQNDQIFQDYAIKFQEFLNNCDLATELDSAQHRVLEKYTEVAENLDSLKQQNNELVRSLMGTGLYQVSIRSILIQRIIYRTISAFFPDLVLNHIEVKDYFKRLISKIRR